MLIREAIFRFQNETFAGYAFYSSAVLLKTLAMGGMTAFRRIQCGVYSNPEDAKLFLGPSGKVTVDERVERLRRNHLNDLENVLPFVSLGFLYMATQPDDTVALWHFRLFAASRFLHTASYQFQWAQPSRFIFHLVCLAVNLSMGVQVIMKAIQDDFSLK